MADETAYHALFRKAAKLVKGRIILDGRHLSRPGFFERRRLVKALRLLERAAEVEPPYGGASFLAAKVEERLGNSEESLYWLRKAKTVAPDSLIVDLELGIALSKQGHHAEAVRLLSAAAVLDPEDPRVHNNLGLAFLLAGDTPASVAAFERLVAIEPGRAMNNRLLEFAQDVEAGRKPQPKDASELDRI